MDAYKQEYTTMGIAASGVYAKIGDNISVSIPDKRLFAYLGNLVDGGIVIDKRTVPDADLVKWVISGPMMKEGLPSGTKDSLNFETPRAAPIPAKHGDKFSGMDYIALDLYVKLWEGLGARIGTRKGDIIYWNDGESQPIPPIESRWQQER